MNCLTNGPFFAPPQRQNRDRKERQGNGELTGSGPFAGRSDPIWFSFGNRGVWEESSMADKTKFRGSFTALVTPFKNGGLDEAAFRSLVNWQIAEGTHGLVPVGTTGASTTLSDEEHKKVVEWCIDEVKGR